MEQETRVAVRQDDEVALIKRKRSCVHEHDPGCADTTA
jgi:hypothetical protein